MPTSPINALASAVVLTAATVASSAGQASDADVTAKAQPGHIVQFVRFESNLSRDAVLAAAEERKPAFEAMPGLVQKYYLELEAPNTYGGIYIWESKAAMAAFLQSDTFKAIPAAYGISGKPQVEVIPVLFPLR